MSTVERPVKKRAKKRTGAQRVEEARGRTKALCNAPAPTSATGRCRKPAGKGTAHVGSGRCSTHGGNTPEHTTHATMQRVTVMGSPLNITPMDAILWTVQISAGEVAYASAQVAALEGAIGREKTWKDRPLSHGKDGESSTTRVRETTTSEPRMALWIKIRHTAMKNLATYSKLALDAGIAERQVRMSEQTGESIARMLEGILADLELTDEQAARAPGVVRHHLTVATTGNRDSSLLPPIPAALEAGTLAGGLFDVEGSVIA